MDAAGASVRPLPRGRSGIGAWVRAARVRQWTKNLLVFGAPAAAGALGRPGVLWRTSLATFAFCLLSSGVYLINDVLDAAEDRRHPVKRHRPIAAGAIPAAGAIAAGVGAVAAGAAIGAGLGSRFLGVAVAYAALNVCYSLWLRQIAIADIASIAGAFVLRAVAGGVAVDVPISRWFIVVVSFAALFVAAGKRYADYLDPASRGSRAVLAQYTADFLRLVIGVACAVSLGAYCLWAFQAVRPGVTTWRELTIVPFTILLLRYGLLITQGRSGAPEEILFSDRFTQVVGTMWLVMFGLGI
jgi:decaprenyl-phosphate phosphoribosyltransferase